MTPSLSHQRERDDRSLANLQLAIDVLTGVLLFTVALTSVALPRTFAGLNIALCVAYGVVYFYGTFKWRRWPAVAQWAWMTVFTMLWVLMLPVSSIALYLILPMFFIYLLVFNDIRGIVAVVLGAVVGILSQLPTGLSVAGILGPFFSAFMVIGAYWVFKRVWEVSEERQRLIDELVETRHQLAESERAAGIAAERQRIAHEIHDTVAQGLSSIQMLVHVAMSNLEKLDTSQDALAPVKERLQQVQRTAADNLAEARAMIAALQPASLSEGTLEAAMKRVAESFSASGNMKIDVVVDGDPYPLPMKVEAALLRIGQGALGNVTKHAKATRARISLYFYQEQVRMDVVDNGQGFDFEAVRSRPAGLGHVGLDAMRRRAAEIGGDLTIESAPGEGTALSIAVPTSPIAEG